MSENIANEELMSDDQILEHNQKLRKKIVDKIVQHGVPSDQDSQYVLLTTMKDMDKQIIDKKRVAIEDKNSNIASVVAEAVTKISSLVDGGDPFKRTNQGEIPVADKTRIPDYIPVPGETEVGITSENYDDFMARNGKSSRSTGIESD